MFNEAYIWLGGCASTLAKSSKILLNENTLGCVGAAAAGVDPNVNGVLLSVFFSVVPKEKSELVGAVVDVVAGLDVVVGALMEGVVLAVLLPKLNEGVVVVVVVAGLGEPNEKAVVAGLSDAVLVVVGKLKPVVVGLSEEVVGFPKDNVGALVGVEVTIEGAVLNENPVVVLVVGAVVDLSVLLLVEVEAGVVLLTGVVVVIDPNPVKEEGVVVGVVGAVEDGVPNVNTEVGAAGVDALVVGVLEVVVVGVEETAGVPKVNPDVLVGAFMVEAAAVVVVVVAGAGEPNEMVLVVGAVVEVVVVEVEEGAPKEIPGADVFVGVEAGALKDILDE